MKVILAVWVKGNGVVEPLEKLETVLHFLRKKVYSPIQEEAEEEICV